jgi:PKD repeat protein
MRKTGAILFLLLAVTSGSASDTLSRWLDTIAPKVLVTPLARYHNQVFHVALQSSEMGTVWVGVNSAKNMQPYTRPQTIMAEGTTTIHYYAEDMVGNRSAADSVEYVLDTRAPPISVQPPPGRFAVPITVRFLSDEPCRFLLHHLPDGSDTSASPDSIRVTDQFDGYVTAVDRAGNMQRSPRLFYAIDTAVLAVAIQPGEGTYNTSTSVVFTSSAKADIFYSFDPTAPKEWFTQYSKPAILPYGLTLVRYFGRGADLRETAIRSASYTIDTLPPKIRAVHNPGKNTDTLILITREPTSISYCLDENCLLDWKMAYMQPFIIPHQGRFYVKAQAKDRAGNLSERFVWQMKYDRVAPVITPSLRSGVIREPATLRFSASEPAQVFYTLDRSAAGEKSLLYGEPVTISKRGVTHIRYVGVDKAGNSSLEDSLTINLDTEPPRVAVSIDGSARDSLFRVQLIPDEPASIYYLIGEGQPTLASTCYSNPLSMQAGQIVTYFAVDMAGNRSPVVTMNDLRAPIIEIEPKGAVFNRIVKIKPVGSADAALYWRMPPDSVFDRYRDSIVLSEEGLYSIEYFSESAGGLRSPVRREEYVLDWTSPRVAVTIRKGAGDSAVIFLDANENASIYYTLDGSSPFFSTTSRVAGNKLMQTSDRIVVGRDLETKLVFFAEDAAGNQSSISVIDIFKPRVIPSIPAGIERVHNRVLSIALNTIDEQSQIFFERHGVFPTFASPRYSDPITLTRSDTIIAVAADFNGDRGEADTFIYRIDLPPAPQFNVAPAPAVVGQMVHFDATSTVDGEGSTSALVFSWDFDGDGIDDSLHKGTAATEHRYTRSGRYRVRLTVTDPGGQSATQTHDIPVQQNCPPEMVSFVPLQGQAFCIDRYEWPGMQNHLPTVGVSWIQAAMHCFDAGKRLCTHTEWKSACFGENRQPYPYGDSYRVGACPTEGRGVYPSGHFSACSAGSGAFDMVGNAWEWVDLRDGEQRLLVGGSFNSGRDATCGAVSAASLQNSFPDAGFRCCR